MCHSLWRQKVNVKELIEKLADALGLSKKETQNNKSYFLCKQGSDGIWRWVAIFSNKYRDEDNPPEILSEASHLDFVKAVDDGEWEMPELWLAHIPGTKWGTTQLVAYDTANGFSLAAGTVDEGKEAIAEALNSLPPERVGVSHGMPRKEIQRDETDASVLVRYRSKEISPLPLTMAANKLTGFGVKEMNISQEKEAKLREQWGDETVDRISELLDLKGKEAHDQDLEFKENEEVVEEVKTEEATETEVADSPSEPVEEVKEEATEVETPALTKEEVADAISFMTENLTKAYQDAVTPLVERIASLEAEVTRLKTADEEKVAEKAAWTTRAAGPSLREILENSAIGKEQARIDGRTKEAQGPKEAPVTKTYTGNPIIDMALGNTEESWQKGMFVDENLFQSSQLSGR